MRKLRTTMPTALIICSMIFYATGIATTFISSCAHVASKETYRDSLLVFNTALDTYTQQVTLMPTSTPEEIAAKQEMIDDVRPWFVKGDRALQLWSIALKADDGSAEARQQAYLEIWTTIKLELLKYSIEIMED